MQNTKNQYLEPSSDKNETVLKQWNEKRMILETSVREKYDEIYVGNKELRKNQDVIDTIKKYNYHALNTRNAFS